MSHVNVHTHAQLQLTRTHTPVQSGAAAGPTGLLAAALQAPHPVLTTDPLPQTRTAGHPILRWQGLGPWRLALVPQPVLVEHVCVCHKLVRMNGFTQQCSGCE